MADHRERASERWEALNLFSLFVSCFFFFISASRALYFLFSLPDKQSRAELQRHEDIFIFGCSFINRRAAKTMWLEMMNI